MELAHMFSPLRVGPVSVKNRVYMTPHTLNYAEPVPGEPSLLLPTERHVHYYAERARGGVGLIIVEGLVVHPSSDYPPFLTSTGYDPRCVPPLAKIAKAIHQYGSKAFIEPWHAGHHATTERSMARALSSSPTPPVERFATPKEMDESDIEDIQLSFEKATLLVKEAGFDGMELHATHSYLFNQFLSPFYNKRTDMYGGTLENRMRFVVEVLKRVREKIGQELALGLRLVAEEMLPGGLDNDAMQLIASRLEATGLIDFLDVDIGTYHTWPLNIAPMYVQPHHEVDYIAGIKEAVKRIPILGCLGRLTNLVEAEKYLVEGKMDMVGGARGFIAEPELVKKTQEGRLDDIITCIACNQFCLARNMVGLSVHCVLNPVTGREKEWGYGTLKPSSVAKNVIVVGGGPSGLEAARVLAAIGHRVTVYEREKELGGQLILAAKLPGREVIQTTVRWYENQMRKLGVKVVLGTEANEKIILREGPDVVIIATGSSYVKTGFSGFITQPIPGWEQSNVLTPEQYLRGEVKPGKEVIILDDESFVTAVGIAEMLASEGKNVEIITRWHHVGFALFNTAQMHVIYPRLFAKGVKMTPNHYIKEIRGRKVTIFNIFTNEEIEREVDSVIMVTAKEPHNHLLKELRGKVREIHSIGDCASPRGFGEAIYEGHKIGRMI